MMCDEQNICVSSGILYLGRDDLRIKNNLPTEIYSTTLIYEEWSGGPSIDGKLCSEEEVNQRSQELWQYVEDAIPSEDFEWYSLESFVQSSASVKPPESE